MSKQNKRPNGEGSFHKRTGSNLWERTITVGYHPVTGKRIRKTVTGKTKATVNEKLAKLRESIATGVSPTAANVRVGQFLADWLKNLSLESSTYARYESLLRNHVIPVLGGYKLKTLTASEIKWFIAALIQKEASPQTIKHAYDALRAALGHAVVLGLLNRNPCKGLKLPEVKKREIIVMTEAEVERFLVANKNHRLYTLFLLVATLGLRQGEAFALDWVDLDLERSVLQVRHTLRELNGKLTLVEPKTDRSRRKLDLPVHLVEALKLHRTLMEAEGHLGSIVFPDCRGGHLRKSNFLRRDYYPALAAAGIKKEGFTFHDLRHTAATIMLSRGLTVVEVSEILGHDDPSFTLGTYLHVLPSMRLAATKKIGSFFDEILGRGKGEEG